MRRATGFRISPRARINWEHLSVRMSIQDVVEAIFSLPPVRIKEPEHARTKPHGRLVHARVGGRLFMMAGKVNVDGDWLTAEIVLPVWPPE